MRRINRGRTLVLCLFASGAFLGLLPGMAQATPVNTGAPGITGTAQQGQLLTASQGTWGTDTDPIATITSYSYQWQSGGVNVGTNSPTYTPALTDVGKTIDVVVTATDNSTTTTTTASSPPSLATATVAGINTALPSIVGTAQQGGTLTVTNGVWTGTPTITNQWEGCSPTCAPILGATGASYLLGPGDVGHKIEVVETATYTGEAITPPTATSAQTAVVTTSVPPTITGTALPGQTLTLTQGTWPNAPLAVSDQWESCISLASCSPVGPANSSTYTVAPSDVGHAIEIVETATYSAGAAIATSLATATVTSLANTTSPSISGIAQQGQTLTAIHGIWNAASVSFSDQWEDCSLTCTPIPNATGQTYAVQPGDVGQEIVVVENVGNGSLGVPSSPTAVVTGTSGISLAVYAPGNPATNRTVTLVAAISSSSSNADPSGWVTFFDSSTAISGCTKQSVKPTGQIVTIVCQANFPAGTALISAAYAPDAGSLISGSSSAFSTLGIGKDSTSTSLAVTKKVARGKPAMYTATVVLPASNSGPIEPTGSIEFLDAGKPIRTCLSQPLRQLTATCTLKYRSKGSHRISAVYGGDPNFTPSTSSTTSVQIGKGSSVSPVVLGFIRSTLGWSFHYHPAYTQVLALRAYGVPSGVTVLLTCTGGGCPFGEIRTSMVGIPRCSRATTGACAAGSSINLLPAFKNHRLRAGTKITLRFIEAGWIGKYYSFTVRGGRAPATDLKCVGTAGHPGVGC